MVFGVDRTWTDSVMSGLQGVVLFILILGIPGAILFALIKAIFKRNAMMVIAWVLIFPIYAFGLSLAAYWMAFGGKIRTAKNISPAEVSFLRMPSSASQIDYWQASTVWIADFTIPEKDFVQMFPKFPFSEISKQTPIKVQSVVFGRPEVENPFFLPAIPVTTGLHFETKQTNNGGFNIVYDRAKSRAYFRYFSH